MQSGNKVFVKVAILSVNCLPIPFVELNRCATPDGLPVSAMSSFALSALSVPSFSSETPIAARFVCPLPSLLGTPRATIDARALRIVCSVESPISVPCVLAPGV